MHNKILIFLILISSLQAKAIINGYDISNSDPLAKSVVALQMVENKTNYYKGSAVIIAKNVLLTAGHNFFYLPDTKNSEAIFDVQPKWGETNQGQKRIKIKKVFMYPGFTQNSQGTRNDLALVILNEPIPNDYQPLPIDFSTISKSQKLRVIGYGRSTVAPTDLLSDYRLRSIDLPFARTAPQKIWLSNTVGSTAGGDSGGPALAFKDNSYQVRGIVLHQRYDSCVKDQTCAPQSAFADMAFFRTWIEKSISQTTH